MRKILFYIIVGVGVILTATSVPANALKFELDEEYTGGAEPLGDPPPPWLTAEITDGAAVNTVEISLSTSGLTGSEFVSGWYFNWNLEAGDLTGINPFVPITVSNDGLNAGGALGHGFDLLFNFPTAEGSRFGANETRVYTFTATGVTESSFDFLNAAGNFYSAAHVQSIDNPDFTATSGWIGATSSIAAIPEPGTILLLGAGLASLFGIRRFKFKKN